MLSDDIVVTHRIIEIVPAVDENGAPVINDRTGKQAIRFVTKGDANNSADGALLHENNVIGKPIFSIPALGYVADYIQNPPGTYIAIVVACLLLLATFLPDILFPDEKKKEDENAAQAVSAEQLNAAKQEIEEIKSQLAATEQNAPHTEDAAAAEADAPAETADNGGDNNA
jgi:signal peptidase